MFFFYLYKSIVVLMNIIWVGPAQFEQTSPKTENNFRLCPKNMPALSASCKNCIESVSREEKVTDLALSRRLDIPLAGNIQGRSCVYVGWFMCLCIFRFISMFICV